MLSGWAFFIRSISYLKHHLVFAGKKRLINISSIKQKDSYRSLRLALTSLIFLGKFFLCSFTLLGVVHQFKSMLVSLSWILAIFILRMYKISWTNIICVVSFFPYNDCRWIISWSYKKYLFLILIKNCGI